MIYLFGGGVPSVLAVPHFFKDTWFFQDKNYNTVVGGSDCDANPLFAHFRGFIADSSTMRDVMCQCFNKHKTANAQSSQSGSRSRTESIKSFDI